jgi:type IV pilus assembly protein PilQ
MLRIFLLLTGLCACAGAASAAPRGAAQEPAPAAVPAAPNLRDLLQPVPPSAGPQRADGVSAAIPAARLEAESTSIAQVLGSTAAGTTTKAYTIVHLRAAEVQALVADPAAPLLGRDATVVADSRSNTLFVKGSEADHQLVENLVRRIDVPVKQILVEVKIVSADEFFGKSLGARFGVTSSHLLNVATDKKTGVQVAGSNAELHNIATTGTSTFQPMVSLPATNTLTTAAPSTFAVGLYKIPAGINIELELSALEEAGHTKVLSSPKLVLSNFKPGLLSSGQRIPYSRPSIVQGVNTTEFVDAKVSITVTALVAPDGSISMDLALTDDSVGAVSPVGPTINTNQVTSNVTLRSGETLLLGGFKNSVQTKETDKTPLLGDVPLLGNLFKSTTDTSVKRELMFVITPTVIDAGM